MQRMVENGPDRELSSYSRMLRMGGGQSVHGTIAEKEEPGCPAPWPHPQPPLPPSPAPSVTSSGAGASAGPGVCGWLLIAASWLLVLVTLPFSLCVCFKVVFPLSLPLSSALTLAGCDPCPDCAGVRESRHLPAGEDPARRRQVPRPPLHAALHRQAHRHRPPHPGVRRGAAGGERS